MQNNDILLLFNYNYWANARVLKACSELPKTLYWQLYSYQYSPYNN
jgi:uncharacterized damage-inducible protein DinB